MTLSEPLRVAVYYAPERDDPLWAAGVRWLGRDPETNEHFALPEVIPGADIIHEAAGYGFHGTLKPPMRLAEGQTYQAFLEAVADLARGLTPFTLPRFSMQNLHGFLAVREVEPSTHLQALADIAVAALDSFRAAPAPEELARRRRGGLSPAQDAMLVRWGYPYVFQQWYFHLTLSRRLDAAEIQHLKPAAEAWFAAALEAPRRVESLAVYTQAEAGAPFALSTRIGLG